LRGVRETAAGRIELGDIVVAVDGKPVETVDDLMDALEKYKIGDRVKVDVIRNKKRQSVDVTLQAVN
jgi:S1-C subfamily serine protease